MSQIQAVLLDNRDPPLKLEINSWVTLRPGTRGGHARDALKHGGSSIRGSYKAKVLNFQIRSGRVSSVLVEHAYMRRQLYLDPAVPLMQPNACNYLYPSSCKDWIDPESVLGVIVVIHGEIGELTRGSRTHAKLLDDSIFFYNANYIQDGHYGRLVPIALPSFDSIEWQLPDMGTSEAFRAKLRQDFQASMKPNIGSKLTHLSWFMPIGVFIDLFSVAEEQMHRTPTMFVFKSVSEDLCSSLMDQGWDDKVTIGADIIRTKVHLPSLGFRYHLGRSTLYSNFVYNRSRMISHDVFEAIDQNEQVTIVTVHCEMGNIKTDVEVGLSWSLYDVRQEIAVQIEPALEFEFQMYIISDGQATKVNTRKERMYTVSMVLPPKKLEFRVRH